MFAWDTRLTMLLALLFVLVLFLVTDRARAARGSPDRAVPHPDGVVPMRVSGVDVYVEGPSDAARNEGSIVFLHGWPDTYRLWDRQVAFLRKRYRCVRFTLPGFDIAAPRGAVSLEGVGGVSGAVVAAACPGERVTLLVHGWGAVYGYHFARTRPALVRRVIGVDVGARSRCVVRVVVVRIFCVFLCLCVCVCVCVCVCAFVCM